MEVPLYIALILYLYIPVPCYSNFYYNHTLDVLCKQRLTPIRTMTPVELGRMKKSAAIVKGVYPESTLSSRRGLDCQFKVKAMIQANGLFAVIQNLSLRQTPQGSCIDFVQIRNYNSSDIVPTTYHSVKSWENHYKYCGEYGKLHEPRADKPISDNLAPNAFKSNSGEIAVRVYFSDTKPEPNQTVGIEIAFTSYERCSGDTGAYRHCGNKTCIYKEYFDDKIVNCPYLKCVDEHGCAVSINGDGMESVFPLNTRVTVTATTSIFLSFFLFLGCIWLCRYFDMLCWTERTVGGGGGGAVGGSGGDSLNMEMSSVEPVNVPTAPSPDKDLPPAYETLFPDR